ncbi:hypothetical protein K440DRAFT_638307 [Wilcoxina mikolae CBS 423.85]|nr:hypothetical protein K440DRAFT_638307 [Wilcoxina mikolae CBS 423.85]
MQQFQSLLFLFLLLAPALVFSQDALVSDPTVVTTALVPTSKTPLPVSTTTSAVVIASLSSSSSSSTIRLAAKVTVETPTSTTSTKPTTTTLPPAELVPQPPTPTEPQTTIWYSPHPSSPSLLSLMERNRVPTTIAGVPTVVPSIFTQQFSKLYGELHTPSSGSIGLGTQTGEIGVVRTHAASGGGRERGRGSGWVMVVVGMAVVAGWMG